MKASQQSPAQESPPTTSVADKQPANHQLITEDFADTASFDPALATTSTPQQYEHQFEQLKIAPKPIG